MGRRNAARDRGCGFDGRRHVGLLVLYFVVAALAATDASAQTHMGSDAASHAATVIVVSMDGVRHDYPERGAVPAFARIAREGGRARQLVPVFPASTYPSHVSMATGTHPDRHGIVANQFRDAKRGAFDRNDSAGWIEAEPIWIAAERQGRRAATFFWVGSETDWRGLRPTHRHSPFDAGTDEDEKLAQIMAWLDLPGAERPALIMSWWHGSDEAGHVKGPDHPDVIADLVLQDRVLGQLLDALDARALWRTTTLLVVSDHGMTATSVRVPLTASLTAAQIEGDWAIGTGVAHLYLDSPSSDLERGLARLQALDGVDVYPGDRVPQSLRFAYPGRTGDIVLITEPPRTLRDADWWEGAVYGVMGYGGWAPGGHGYAVDHPDRFGIFYAMGRGVSSGTRWESVRAIDLAATIAHLLGIAPPNQSEGVRIEGIGVAAPASKD